MRGDASNVFVVGYVNRPNRTDPRSRVGSEPSAMKSGERDAVIFDEPCYRVWRGTDL
jgi:hypothetical protein